MPSHVRGGPAERGEVLLVEDDEEVAALAREMLGALGFGVVHVTNAVAALGALGNGRPLSAMFADIMIPGGISGLDLAREVQAPPTRPSRRAGDGLCRKRRWHEGR